MTENPDQNMAKVSDLRKPVRHAESQMPVMDRLTENKEMVQK